MESQLAAQRIECSGYDCKSTVFSCTVHCLLVRRSDCGTTDCRHIPSKGWSGHYDRCVQGKRREIQAVYCIVLFRQAGWSQGKYREIGPRLNRLGFNCMAVDQRSGHRVNGVENETAKQAKAADKRTGYMDALPDIDAAIKYTRQHHAADKIIIWGSSYSASLVLKLAGDNQNRLTVCWCFLPASILAVRKNRGIGIVNQRRIFSARCLSNCKERKRGVDGHFRSDPLASQKVLSSRNGGSARFPCTVETVR